MGALNEFLQTKGIYTLVMILFFLGVYGMVLSKNYMKKLMAMVLACCLLLGSAALAESPAEESVKLTYEELQMYMTALREDALKEGSVSIISSQDGPTMAVTAVGNLTIADEQLTQTTAVVGAQLAAGMACPCSLTAPGWATASWPMGRS